MICVAKSAGLWVLFLLVGTNMAGMIFGRYSVPKAATVATLPAAIQRRANGIAATAVGIRVLFAILAAGYLYVLFRYLGLAVAIAAGLLLLAPAPAKVWRSAAEDTAKAVPTGTPGWLALLGSVVTWASLPLIWFGLC